MSIRPFIQVKWYYRSICIYLYMSLGERFHTSFSCQRHSCAAGLLGRRGGREQLYLIFEAHTQNWVSFFSLKKEQKSNFFFQKNHGNTMIYIQKHLSICTVVQLAIILQDIAFISANCHRLGISEKSKKHLNLQKKKCVGGRGEMREGSIRAFYQLP